MAAALAAGALACGSTAPAEATPRLVLGLLPADTTAEDLGRVQGLSLGAMSTGISRVPPLQTYLDIGQGSRTSPALYSRSLPSPFLLDDFTESHTPSVTGWPQLVSRADGVPGEIVPGLLASALEEAGVPVQVERGVNEPAVLGADRAGHLDWVPPAQYPCRNPLCPGVTILRETLHNTRKLVGRLRAKDLLIALATPSVGRRTAAIGIAGRAFAGELTSDSTRTGGYVLSTDIAPTILQRFGIEVPDEMNGEPIRAEGAVEPAAVEDLTDRMSVIPDRREPILVICLVAWSLIAFAVNRVVFGLRRVAMAWLALCFAYMPLLLLIGARLEPTAVAEGLLVGIGAAALAALTLRFVWGWRGLAIASAITVIAYAIDVIAGSGLTRLSLLGPNPIYGVRFYGIGNELEALFAVMVPVGVGAGLSAYIGRGREVRRRLAAITFLVVGAVATIVFAAGQFGADVGAAITLPVGAAVAAASLPIDFEHLAPNRGVNRPKSSRRLVGVVIAAPFAGVGLLLLVDLLSGGNAHLSRSVLDAGGAGDLAELAQRRLELSAHDFGQAAGNPLFWAVVAGIGVAVAKWRRIDAWLTPAPPARSGFLGACAAVAAGVLVNDSGATFLVLGSIALGAALAYAWSQA